MKKSDRYQSLLDVRGIALSEQFGIADIALGRVDALIAVDCLKEDGVPILGGDVFFQRNNRLELANANWYTKILPDEEANAYVERSCLETSDYIRHFPPHADATPLFVLVVAR